MHHQECITTADRLSLIVCTRVPHESFGRAPPFRQRVCRFSSHGGACRSFPALWLLPKISFQEAVPELEVRCCTKSWLRHIAALRQGLSPGAMKCAHSGSFPFQVNCS